MVMFPNVIKLHIWCYDITYGIVKPLKMDDCNVLKRNDPLVRLDGAGLFRSGRWLVRGVDLSVRPGEIVTLIGPNGSGKSTTAKMALGVMTPGEGTLQKQKGLKTAYVPQKIAIDWTLPLRVDALMRLTQPLSQHDLLAALESTGAGHLARSEVRHLSGGEFQRVMLARAMARRPDFLVLDEPVQGVDFAGEIALYDLIKQVRDKTGCGILMISHDLHMVMAATDHVICLNGHVCCHGTPENVAASGEYKQLFGDRAGALALYQHHHDHQHLPDGRVQHGDGSVTDHCFPGDGHHHGGKTTGHRVAHDSFRLDRDAG
jgi:zinc transport system ATP-binding protein